MASQAPILSWARPPASPQPSTPGWICLSSWAAASACTWCAADVLPREPHTRVPLRATRRHAQVLLNWVRSTAFERSRFRARCDPQYQRRAGEVGAVDDRRNLAVQVDAGSGRAQPADYFLPSISAACLRVVSVILTPPSMRTISSTRPAALSGATDEITLPRTPALLTCHC